MIWVQLLAGFVSMLTVFAGPLPDAGSLPLGDFGPFFALIGRVNDAVPIYEAVQALALIISIEIAMSVYVVLRALWRFVPLIGGG